MKTVKLGQKVNSNENKRKGEHGIIKCFLNVDPHKRSRLYYVQLQNHIFYLLNVHNVTCFEDFYQLQPNPR